MNQPRGTIEKFFKKLLFTGLFFLASLAPNAFAGFVDMGTVWFEEGDAGQSVADHQDVTSGSLTAISGTLSSVTDVDVYQIFINDPANFAASTVGGASFDTMLSLFDINGLGIRSNNDASGTSQSLLDASLDGTTSVSNDDPNGPLSPGAYFLTINLPRDIRTAPNDLFLIFTTFGVDNVQLEPSTSNIPFAAFRTPSVSGSGSYQINLTGAVAIPESSTYAMFLTGLIGLGIVRFRGKMTG